ncbi:putative succinate dehydrogenase [ubiquinone] cytochrome b small subunit, mitochondrial, partial [Trichinella pseudospiralis]
LLNMLSTVRFCHLGRASSLLSNPSFRHGQLPTLLKNALPSSPILFPRASPTTLALATRASSTEVREVPPNHATMFKLERVLAVAMLPLFPAALFIHNGIMDNLLAVAVGLHIHFGLHVVVEDYARPFVIGETLSKLCTKSIYLVSILMIAGMLHFNYTDVGITKAFEMIWAL